MRGCMEVNLTLESSQSGQIVGLVGLDHARRPHVSQGTVLILYQGIYSPTFRLETPPRAIECNATDAHR